MGDVFESLSPELQPWRQKQSLFGCDVAANAGWAWQLFAERGRCPPHMRFKLIACAVGLLAATSLCGGADEPAKSWQVGTPIVTYWAGPPLTDKTAQQMTQGGWNLVWCTENELDVAARHSVRA